MLIPNFWLQGLMMRKVINKFNEYIFIIHCFTQLIVLNPFCSRLLVCGKNTKKRASESEMSAFYSPVGSMAFSFPLSEILVQQATKSHAGHVNTP